MRYIKYAFLAIVAPALVAVAVANRDIVTLTLLPSGLAALAGQPVVLKFAIEEAHLFTFQFE